MGPGVVRGLSVPDVLLRQRSRARGYALLVLMASLYVGLAWLASRDTVNKISLIWPAGGLVILWFLIRRAGWRSIDTPVLLLTALVTTYVLRDSWGIAITSALVNTIQGLVGATLLRRLCPPLRWCGGSRPIDTPALLWRVVAALLVATTMGAAIGTTGLRLSGLDPDWLDATLWLGRNFCAALIMVGLGLMVGGRLAMPHPRPPVIPRGRAGKLELVGAILITMLAYSMAFVVPDLPITFFALATTVWVGSRFTPLVLSWHALLLGTMVVATTLRETGPFASVSDERLGFLLGQAFVATLVLTGLALSFAREENLTLATHLREAEERAVYQSTLLAGIVDSITTGVLVIDGGGEVTFRNAAAASSPLPFFRRAEVGQVPYLASYEADGVEVPAEDRPADRALRGETVPPHEALIRDEGEYVVSVAASPLPPDPRTGRARAVVLFQDATQEASRRAELAAFAGVVAHDLRNPLAAIDGWTELIADDVDQGEVGLEVTRRYVQGVRSSAQRMNGLIDDLLQHATSRDRTLAVSRVDVARVVADVAAARAVEGVVTIGVIPPVEADPALLRQVLDNLVGNAIKYVRAGTEPSVEVTGRPDPSGRVLIAVADRGIGLPAGEQEKVFGEFHRAHAREYEGHGLGLSICRRIVARHGGSITARDNTGGVGTVFEFTLPAAGSWPTDPSGPPAGGEDRSGDDTVTSLERMLDVGEPEPREGVTLEHLFDTVRPSAHGGRLGQTG